MFETARDKLRRRGLEALGAARFIELIANHSSKERRRFYQDRRAELVTLGKHDLKTRVEQYETKLHQKRSEFGVTLKPAQLARLLEDIEQGLAQSGTFPMVSRAKLETFIPRLLSLLPELAGYPRHTLFYIEEPQVRTFPFALNWFLLELSLYENLCALFNLGSDQSVEARKPESTRAHVKTERALIHATVSAAYYFVEAYLNGFAFDLLHEKATVLSDKEKELLLEVDPKTGKPRSLTLRDKILQYPRLALQVAHPPFQESNCREMEVLLEKGKPIRDAVAHASPNAAEGSISEKLRAMVTTTWEDAVEITDSAIKLVQLIEKRTRRHALILTHVRDRGPDGRFATDVFA